MLGRPPRDVRCRRCSARCTCSWSCARQRQRRSQSAGASCSWACTARQARRRQDSREPVKPARLCRAPNTPAAGRHCRMLPLHAATCVWATLGLPAVLQGCGHSGPYHRRGRTRCGSEQPAHVSRALREGGCWEKARVKGAGVKAGFASDWGSPGARGCMVSCGQEEPQTREAVNLQRRGHTNAVRRAAGGGAPWQQVRAGGAMPPRRGRASRAASGAAHATGGTRWHIAMRELVWGSPSVLAAQMPRRGAVRRTVAVPQASKDMQGRRVGSPPHAHAHVAAAGGRRKRPSGSRCSRYCSELKHVQQPTTARQPTHRAIPAAEGARLESGCGLSRRLLRREPRGTTGTRTWRAEGAPWPASAAAAAGAAPAPQAARAAGGGTRAPRTRVKRTRCARVCWLHAACPGACTARQPGPVFWCAAGAARAQLRRACCAGQPPKSRRGRFHSSSTLSSMNLVMLTPLFALLMPCRTPSVCTMRT